MMYFPVYKAIKSRLKNGQNQPAIPGLGDLPIFFYIGQYLPGKDKISLVSPALYIEFQKDVDIVQWPTRRQSAKSVEVSIHYISPAPFNSHDNTTQDTAINSHEIILKQIDLLLNGWHAEQSVLDISQRFSPRRGSFLNFSNGNVVSILKYTTEISSYHLVS